MCVFAIVAAIATPSAPPICCDVLRSPDATPATRSWRFASAASETGMKTNASPTPLSTKGTNRLRQNVPSGGSCVYQRYAKAVSARPVAITGLTPTRVMSACAAPAAGIVVPAVARNATPASIGEYPSTCCM